MEKTLPRFPRIIKCKRWLVNKKWRDEYMAEPRPEQLRKHIEWDNFLNYVDVLIDKIQKTHTKYKYYNIYGIPRGGLILAVILSHRLNIPIILNEKDITHKTLIVDDIADSGKTLSEFQKTNDIATIYYKKKSTVLPAYYVIIPEENHWIVFPWEDD